MVADLSFESTLERNALKFLNRLPRTKAVKWSQNGRQKGNPDIICVHNGLCILIEVKRPGEPQTLLQKVTMEEWKEVGTITLVMDHIKPLQDLMNMILREEGMIEAQIKMLEEELDRVDDEEGGKISGN